VKNEIRPVTKSAVALVMLAGMASGLGCGGGTKGSGPVPAAWNYSAEEAAAHQAMASATQTDGPAMRRQGAGNAASAPEMSGSLDPAGEGAEVRTAATNAVPRNARRFDPFWINEAAEKDREKWYTREQGGNPGMANDPAAMAMGSQPSEFERTADALFAESAEGLVHQSFATQGADFDPVASRDGQFIVFSSTQHRPTADIYIKHTGGRAVTQLTNDPGQDVMPSISPDGKRIAFASNRDGNWNVYVMSTAGGKAVQVTSDPAHEVHPSWSPDGSKLVFCRLGEMSGRWEMWVMDVQASAASEFIGFGLFPTWCPVPGTGESGRDKILFQRSRERGDRAFSIWTVDYRPGDTSSPTEVAQGTNGEAAINATWSPDGSRIVFATVQGTDGNLGNGLTAPGQLASTLWMVDSFGGGKVSLTSASTMNLMPFWGNDNRIYFVSDRSGTPNIWSVGTERAIVAATGRPSNETTDFAALERQQQLLQQAQGVNTPQTIRPSTITNVPTETGSGVER
jgi:TolB protein